MEKYDHKQIESKWQAEWEKLGLYLAKEKGEKFYGLIEFPYPSGDGLHVGHVRSNTAMDVIARKRRMQGFNVLYPIGWDAFGLPTENYAIKTGRAPAEITKENTDNFRRQLKSLGFSFDWSREINTTDPAYYKWTQWLFLQFYKQGLAYKKKMTINWCPKDLIGLANEEVVNGCCERCGTPVEQKEKEQWMLAITKYADRLDKDLDDVDYLPQIKLQQRNWIGRSEGAEFNFLLKFDKSDLPKPNYLILHGYEGHADTNFIPWLKKTLETQGYQVQAPELPNTDHPTETEQVEYVINNCETNEQTIIVGHSLGAVVAMKLLQKINRPIAGLVLVAAAMEPEYGLPVREYWETFSWKDINYTTLQNLTKFRTVLCDLQEGEPRASYLTHLASKLKAQLIQGKAQDEHFCNTEEPMILNSILPHLTVFTTRPDTLYGVTFLAIAADHPWVKLAADDQHEVLENKKEVLKFIKSIKPDEEEKRGVELKGVKAVNPATGEEVPVWVTNYVLANYGTGAVMGVPAHDERDAEFAKAYSIPVSDAALVSKEEGITRGNGRTKTTYKLRDWVFSRQRYWGEPIPMIWCESCGEWQPVPEDQLPVELPKVEKYQPTTTGESPLANVTDWVNTTCSKCGGAARRETDTMPNWAGSSWYYLRYTDPHNTSEFASQEALKYFTPVDWYNGGMEHTTIHLLYSRFWHKFLFDQKLVPTSEPYQKRTSHGLILAEGGEKMSKSKGNVVNPDKIVDLYGADTLRLYEMFMGPFDQAIAWSTDSLIGPRRFLERVWQLAANLKENTNNNQWVFLPGRGLISAVEKISEDIEAMKFNTAVSYFMIWLNTLETNGASRKDYELFLKLLAPFAPHITEELWRKIGNSSSIHEEGWPEGAEGEAPTERTIIIQINGVKRDELVVQGEQSEAEVEKMALASPKVTKWLEGKAVKKIIQVKGKIVNIVV